MKYLADLERLKNLYAQYNLQHFRIRLAYTNYNKMPNYLLSALKVW